MSDFSRLEIIAKEKGYLVLDDGTVNGPRKKNIGTIHNGYVFINIKVDGKDKNIRAHRLQAYQKYGDKIYEKGMCVRHLDNNRLNNSISNIALGTNSDNMMDKPKEQRLKDAIHASSFVKKHKHEDIIDFYNKTKSYAKTMEKFSISNKSTLYYIVRKSMAKKEIKENA